MLIILFFVCIPISSAVFLSPIHHPDASIASQSQIQVPVKAGASNSKPLKVTNKCSETIYPAFLTQAGKGPSPAGFRLEPGKDRSLSVSADWQGRVWGRTNCSFNGAGNGPAGRGALGGGMACMTGDCNGQIDCRVSVSPS
jgi:hypothetical protein